MRPWISCRQNDRIDNAAGSKFLFHNNVNNVHVFNHGHVNNNDLDEASSIHHTITAATMITISKNTIPSPEEQRNIDISALEFFLTRQMMNGYHST